MPVGRRRKLDGVEYGVASLLPGAFRLLPHRRHEPLLQLWRRLDRRHEVRQMLGGLGELPHEVPAIGAIMEMAFKSGFFVGSECAEYKGSGMRLECELLVRREPCRLMRLVERRQIRYLLDLRLGVRAMVRIWASPVADRPAGISVAAAHEPISLLLPLVGSTTAGLARSRRSFCKARRILPLTVPTGIDRRVAISWQVNPS